MLVQIVRYKTYDAHGGPQNREKEDGDSYWATPTEKGRYIIYSVAPHISYGKYNFWSAIPWGSSLQFNNKILEVKIHNKWIPITEVNSEWSKFSNEDVIRFIKEALHDLYESVDKRYDYNYIPDKWIFNDFGHISVKYFIDKNNNGKLDKNENIMGDFIHTTPTNELQTMIEKKYHKTQNIVLPQSHGCIHVRPNDIDEMISKGYLAVGNVVQVHKYEEKAIPERINIQKRISQYEAHFFPGLLKMVIYKAPLR